MLLNQLDGTDLVKLSVLIKALPHKTASMLCIGKK